MKNNIFSKIFSITKSQKHNVLTLAGIKIKFRQKEKKYSLAEIFKKTQKKHGTKTAIDVLKKSFGLGKASDIFLQQYINKVSKLVEKEMNSLDSKDIDKPSDYVWSMWLQENPPEIVQACLNSIRKIYPNLIVLTEKNIHNYIDIPDYLKQRLENEQITKTHFSDWVRTALLDKYGGIWLDSTVLLLQALPKDMNNENFCLLRTESGSISNWLIKSNKNNYLIKSMRIFLEEYWKNEDFIFNYFMFHRFFVRYVKYNKKAESLYKKMKFYSNEHAFMIINPGRRYNFGILAQDFDDKNFNRIKESYFVQKLTYKDEEAIKNPNSYYWHIVGEYMN